MSESPSPPLRKEIVAYLRACEHLLSIGANIDNPPQFSLEERKIVHFYVGELAKMVHELAKV